VSIDAEMSRTQGEVDTRLAATEADLNEAVDRAERQINAQVDLVRENMDQYIVDTNHQFAAENDFLKWAFSLSLPSLSLSLSCLTLACCVLACCVRRYQLAGTFTLLAVLIALWHVTAHVRHWWNPRIQRRVLAILWMVPVYAITSWLSLVFPQVMGDFVERREKGGGSLAGIA